jgi:hypothetical protein
VTFPLSTVPTQEQLLSREREIEHLKLAFVKLHRMQFGRKSEKLQRQIEQLEFRLEELESNRSEKEPEAPKTGSRHIRFDLEGGETRAPLISTAEPTIR